MTALGAAVMGGGLVLTGFIGQMWEGYLTYGYWRWHWRGLCLHAYARNPRRVVQSAAQRGAWHGRRRHRMWHTGRPPLSAALIERFGWRVTSMIVGVGCAVLLALVAMLVSVKELEGGAPEYGRHRLLLRTFIAPSAG